MTQAEPINPLHVSLAEAPELVEDILAAGLVANLISSPGIGKSQLAAQIAKKNNLKLIDIRLSQMDPADLNGFPFIIPHDNITKLGPNPVRAGYVPMNIFPIEGDPLPLDENGVEMNGWLILMDEFNSGALSVQAAAYKVILDKMVGMHKLHRNVAMITAGNLATDKAITNRLSTAMQSRLVTLVIRVCGKAFDTFAAKAGFDHRVRSYVKYKPEQLHNFDPNHNDLTYPCPRGWEFMSKLIINMPEIPGYKIPLLTGTVGEGAGKEFFSYCQIFRSLCTFGDILADPENVQFGNEPSVHYALAGLVSHHMDTTNADSLMKFVARLGIDFQVIILRAAIAKTNAVKNTKGVQAWIIKNADEMLG
jgi:hypothetical protein